MKMSECEYDRSAGPFRYTIWNFDGTIQHQRPYYGDDVRKQERRKAPPWLWGVTDQTEPTAPWWNEKQ